MTAAGPPWPVGVAPIAGDLVDDTIVALATPPGRSAVALIRMSGERVPEIAARVIEPWPLAARAATLCTVRDAAGEVLDQVVATFFAAPRSYTGEHVLELSTHGGYAAPAAVLGALVVAGARLAMPGEFTRRAVLGGKMDLVQAEAIGDLIDAHSDAMRRLAVVQLDGALSRRIAAMREALLDLEALLAYEIDFPEEDEGPIPRERVGRACTATLEAIDVLLATAPAGAIVREGAIVVIAGVPNAGKSALFNAMLGEARAIVTDVPGTTRDAIEARAEHGGWPLRLVDTAGLRATDDVVERLGIEVSERYLAGAHLVLVCGETAGAIGDARARIAAVAPDVPVVAVRTKADVSGPWGSPPDERDERDERDGAAEPPERHPSDASRTVGPAPLSAVSALSGAGVVELLDRVAEILRERYGAPVADMPVLTRARHVAALGAARAELGSFRQAWERRELPAPVAAVHVRAAVHALDEIIGAVDVEDVLGRVFETFCVGK